MLSTLAMLLLLLVVSSGPDMPVQGLRAVALADAATTARGLPAEDLNEAKRSGREPSGSTRTEWSRPGEDLPDQDSPAQEADLCAGLGPEATLLRDATWDAAGSPYRVDCLLRVAAEVELRIEPGVELRFGPDAGLVLSEGSWLVIDGEAPGDVLMHSAADVPAPGDWAGLVFERASGDLRGFTIRHARTAISARGAHSGELSVERAEIADSAADGIRVRDFDGLSVEDSLLRGNAGFGLHLSGWGWAQVVGNRFVGNGQAGYVDHDGGRALEVWGNLAVGNGRDSFWIAGRLSDRVEDGQALMPGLANEVRGELRVPVGMQLDLAPGTRLDFDRGSRIRVDGRLTAAHAILGPSQRQLEPGLAWEGIQVEPSGQVVLLHNQLMGAGAGRGAVSLAGAGMDSPEFDNERVLVGNRFQQLFGTGLRLETDPDAPPTVRDNLLRSLQDLGGVGSVGLRVAGPPVEGPSPELVVEGNGFGDMGTAILVERAPGLQLPRNAYDGLAGPAVENRDLARCLPAPESWWGSADGPRDDSRDRDDPCGPDLRNRASREAVAVGDGVDYRGWLEQPPAPMPRLDGPACGVTRRTELLVSGQLDGPRPWLSEVQLLDSVPQVFGEGAVTLEGRFAISVSLEAGHVFLAARSRRLDAPGTEGPLTGHRRLFVDPALPLDPMGTRFVQGARGSEIRQPLRDALGCAAGCEGAGGFAVLPPGEPVRLEVPVAGDVVSVTLEVDGADVASIPLQPLRDELWSTASFTPTEGVITIRVERAGEAPFECPGYVHLAPGGRVFLDTGATGEPVLDEGFEEGRLGGWVASRGWQVTELEAHEGRFAVTDSPDGPYGPDVEATLSQLLPLDLSGIEAPELSFWQRYRLAAGDRAWVEARAGGGDPWRRLADFEGTIGDWRQARVALADYAGGTVQLRFRLTTDDDLLTLDDGWTLDDIRIGPGGAYDGRDQAGEPSLAGAEVQLLRQQPDTGAWLAWTAEGQRNPQTVGSSGRYGFYDLEPGAYRARVQPRGQAAQLTPITLVTDGRFDEPLALRPARGRVYIPYALRPPDPAPGWMRDRAAAPYHAYLPTVVEQSKQTTPGIRRYGWSRYGRAEGLGSDAVNDIEIGPDGSAWVVSGPLRRREWVQGRWRLVELLPASIGRIHPDGRVESQRPPETLGAGELYDLVFDPAGEVWIAADGGLVHLDGQGRWRLHVPPGEWANDGRTAIVRDGSGTIWLPTCDALFAYSAAGRWQRHDLPPALDTGLCGIGEIVIDPEGTKWLLPEYGSHRVAGLTAGGQWRIFDPEGFLADDFEITDIAYAPNGDLWIAGWWGAFQRRADGTWQRYDEDNSMLDAAESMAIDAEGNVWFGSVEMRSLTVRWADGSWQGYREDDWPQPEPPHRALPDPPWESMGADRLVTGPGPTVWMRDGYDDGGVIRFDYGEEVREARWP